MRAKKNTCVLTIAEYRVTIWPVKFNYSPHILQVALANVRSKGMVLLLMIRCALLLPLFLGFCVVVQYLVYFLVLHLMEREREREREMVALLQLYS